MWVVKLGGSLMGTPELKEWLTMLVRQSDGQVVIVPGGGVFADTVRRAQPLAGFDNATAHHMALLAMEQFALVMKSLQPALVSASSELEIAERSWQHRAIVWMPCQMVLADDTIPQTWDVTSDSLAAWLCTKIDAAHLVLVKHAQQLPDVMSRAQLITDGVVDAAFGTFSAMLTCPVDIIHYSHHAAFSAALAGSTMPGTRAN